MRYKNDHAPVFDAGMVTSATIPEGTSSGTYLGIFKATDYDIGSQSTVTYSLSPDLGYLSINNNNGTLTVSGTLDRELTPQIKVDVVATDNAPPEFQKSTKHSFVLVVSDLNDNAPQFDFNNTLTKPYHYVRETVKIGEVAMVATATDLDEGENARMVYALVSRNDSGMFEFDPTSAHFKVKGTKMIIFIDTFLISNEKSSISF